MEPRVHFAICHHCGQTMMIESTEEMTEEKLREHAIYACKCPRAVKEREFIEFDKQFTELLGDGAEESGFMASKKNIHDLMTQIARDIREGHIIGASVKLAQHDVVRVFYGKHGIALSRREIREK